jgi:hypothetical protein
VFAFALHAHQERKGSGIPYIAHLMSVAALVLEHGGDEDQAIAGLLHDAIEDMGPEQEAAIAERFGWLGSCAPARTLTFDRSRPGALGKKPISPTWSTLTMTRCSCGVPTSCTMLEQSSPTCGPMGLPFLTASPAALRARSGIMPPWPRCSHGGCLLRFRLSWHWQWAICSAWWVLGHEPDCYPGRSKSAHSGGR